MKKLIALTVFSFLSINIAHSDPGYEVYKCSNFHQDLRNETIAGKPSHAAFGNLEEMLMAYRNFHFNNFPKKMAEKYYLQELKKNPKKAYSSSLDMYAMSLENIKVMKEVSKDNLEGIGLLKTIQNMCLIEDKRDASIDEIFYAYLIAGMKLRNAYPELF